MATLLFVSSDPQSVTQMEQIAEELDVRLRAVSSPDSAKEWLSMRTYNVLIGDSRFDGDVAVDLINLGWKYNPLMMAGLLNFYGPVKDEWSARLIGARVFAGENAGDELAITIQGITPKSDEWSSFPILLVEDLDSPRDIICSYVESLGYSEINGVGSAPQAMEMLRKNPLHFRCVITDINMPQTSGLQLIEDIRKDDRIEHIPIIVLTAYATAENLLNCIRAGATGFLVKPPRKRALQVELDKARRIMLGMQSPRLCDPDDAHMLESALGKLNIS